MFYMKVIIFNKFLHPTDDTVSWKTLVCPIILIAFQFHIYFPIKSSVA